MVIAARVAIRTVISALSELHPDDRVTVMKWANEIYCPKCGYQAPPPQCNYPTAGPDCEACRGKRVEFDPASIQGY